MNIQHSLQGNLSDHPKTDNLYGVKMLRVCICTILLNLRIQFANRACYYGNPNDIET